MEGDDVIVGKSTGWWYRRTGLLLLVVAGIGCWFLYDGHVNWPKLNARHDEYGKFENGEDGRKLTQWPKYAAQQGWPEKKAKFHSEDSILWQKRLGYGCLGLAVVLLIHFLNERRKTLRADGESFTTPSGKRVLFESVTKVDKRRWAKQGLAYIHYSEGGAAKKARLDDLRFDVAGKIMERILLGFEGEVVGADASPAPAPAAKSEEETPPGGQDQT